MRCLSLWSGTLALLIGISFSVHPFTTIAMIGWIIALLVFVSGITSLLIYTNSIERSSWYLLQSILSITFGIIPLSNLVMPLSSTAITIAAYRILTSGILRLISGFQMRRTGFYGANRFLSSAVLVILLGPLLLFNPALSVISIGRLTGLLLMAVGVSGIIFPSRV